LRSAKGAGSAPSARQAVFEFPLFVLDDDLRRIAGIGCLLGLLKRHFQSLIFGREWAGDDTAMTYLPSDTLKRDDEVARTGLYSLHGRSLVPVVICHTTRPSVQARGGTLTARIAEITIIWSYKCETGECFSHRVWSGRIDVG
jgi:hypothetical protein